ncbi:multidrug DMT transporter permease [Aliidiomarina taiwanensis]|uniref:Multidrug DMT transporter permease n=1 Tax=Aliidiomarina taiwanensis TaxID=946228 RepID=A0A432X908_9GAMM|nr:DMT family transporter [Aliidiomarina taiwanensis]RUO43893.1 multidrug DMT transporter permease [Aliidiomarina taiwanensis]
MLNIPPFVIASALVLLAELCFAGVSALVKHTSAQLPFEHLVFFRNLFALLVLLPWLYRKRATAFRTEQFGLHILRAVFGIAAMYLFFLVIATIPLAQATLVLLLAPFLIPIISYFWLKEHIRPRLFATIALGFVGAFVFLNPAQQALHPMVGVAFIAAIFAAWTKTMIRKLSATESPSKIVFYFSFFASVLSFFPLLIRWQPIPLSAWLGILGIGLFAVIGQLAMTRAFSIAPPSQVGVFTYSSVIFAALLGYLFWGEAITSYMVAGFVIILSAGYLTLKR